MKLLWHSTRLDFIDEILKEGIKANIPLQRSYKPKGVYLSEFEFNWMWNTTREGRFKGAAIQIEIEGLKLIEDYHVDRDDIELNSKRIGRDYICLTDIKPERIRQILIETEPNTFQPIELNGAAI